MKSKFKPCPWCGGVPCLTDSEWRDDRRYFAVDVVCCARMEVAIGWNEAKNMTNDKLKTLILERAEKEWNTRTAGT